MWNADDVQQSIAVLKNRVVISAVKIFNMTSLVDLIFNTRCASKGVQINYKLKTRCKKYIIWRHCFSLYLNFGKRERCKNRIWGFIIIKYFVYISVSIIFRIYQTKRKFNISYLSKKDKFLGLLTKNKVGAVGALQLLLLNTLRTFQKV